MSLPLAPPHTYMEHPIAALLGTVTGIAVGIVVGAFLIQFATNWLAGFKPKYGTAILAATLGNLASFGIGFVSRIAIDNNKGEVTGSVTLLLLVIGFFVQAAFYSFMLKDPAGVALGYGRACLVTLIQVAVAAVALGAIYLMALGAIALSKG